MNTKPFIIVGCMILVAFVQCIWIYRLIKKKDA